MAEHKSDTHNNRATNDAAFEVSMRNQLQNRQKAEQKTDEEQTHIRSYIERLESALADSQSQTYSFLSSKEIKIVSYKPKKQPNQRVELFQEGRRNTWTSVFNVGVLSGLIYRDEQRYWQISPRGQELIDLLEGQEKP